MTVAKPEPPQWPEEGEDVKEVDPFTLADGDRIYIMGQGSDLEGTITLGPSTNRGRLAKLVSPSGARRRPIQIPRYRLPMMLNEPYSVWAVDGHKPISTAHITAIRIVRTKPPTPS